MSSRSVRSSTIGDLGPLEVSGRGKVVGAWSEDDSRDFLDLGDLFVPRRDEQAETVVQLLPPPGEAPLRVLELCCGGGLLAQRILENRRDAVVTGFDRSSAMVLAARAANARFGDRFRAFVADLERFRPRGRVDAVVSSLALHHLDHEAKRTLFGEVAGCLGPGGAFLIADIVEPVSDAARSLAARNWDAEVARVAARAGRSEALDVFRADRWNHFALAVPDPGDRPALLADQLDWLRQAGFARVDAFWAFAGHAVFGAFKD